MTDMTGMQSGRIDPDELDVTEKSARVRQPRNRPEPRDELKQWADGAEKRVRARSIPPGIMLEPAGFDKEHWTAPHSDDDLWSLQLAEAFGTRSQAVMSMFLHQLEALCRPSHWDDDARQWRLDEHEYSAMIALVDTVKPRNEIEAALAAQMVAVHLMTMKVAARALRYDADLQSAATAAKLARTFTLQMAELRAGRTKRQTVRQSIKVRKELHQHVHYHDTRGAGESHGQPHGRAARAADKCAALPSPDEGRDALPLPGAEGEGALQAARRKIARRT